ncbi:S-layer homology domain-containing protein, partial [Acidaminococcus fermentans]
DKIVKQDLGKAIQIKGDTTYKADGSVEKAGNIKTSIDNGAIKVELNKDVDLGNDGSVSAGQTKVDQNGVDTNKITIKDSSISITKDGINGGSKQITNVASGASEIIKGEDGKDVYKYDNDTNAANIGDVKQLAQQEAQASAAKSGKNITVKDDDHTVNLNDHITLGDTADKARQVDIDGTGAKVTAGDRANKVTVDGSNGQVTIGTGDHAMTLGKQANTAGDSNPKNGNYLNGLDNRKWDGEHIQNGRAATEDQLKTVSDQVKSGRVFQGDDDQKVTVGLGDTLKIQGGAKDVSNDNNIGIVKGADDTLQVRLAKDLTGLNSVTTGNTTINNGGLTVNTGDANRTITVQDGNVNMGGNTISGVAPGKVSPDSTEAVNGSQLYARDQAIGKLGNTVNHLDNKINRAGAGAAALAALHPQDFDPDDKWDFAAGYGNYHGASAAAIGAFYRPTEDVMVSVGGSMGGGENMVNAGVTFKLGQHNHVSNSRVAMAKEIRDLKALVARQDGEMQQLKTLMNQLAGKPVMRVDKDALFPDIPENHWAYEYVIKLARAGIIEGYEDGQFKGDRMMTRYEFAALLYRAIMAGAAANPDLNQDGTLGKLVKEFDGELKYIRIDVIEKDKHGKPTIERVRTVEDSEKHHGK